MLSRYMNPADFLHVRPFDPDLGHRPGLHFRQSRRLGTRWHGRERRQNTHLHRALLLGRRDSGHDLPGRVHDAFYYGSKARSVPEYLKMRFDERVRALNAVAFAVMTIFASGISMDALAKLLTNLLPWQFAYNLGGLHLGSYDVYLCICSASC